MPNQLTICIDGRYKGSPPRAVLHWVESTLGVSDEDHRRQKNYSIDTWRSRRGVMARIVLKDPEHLTQLYQATSEPVYYQGKWCDITSAEAIHVPISSFYEAAPERRLVEVRAVTPVAFSMSGITEPLLSKQRLIHSAQNRWESMEDTPPPEYSPGKWCEMFRGEGRTMRMPDRGHIKGGAIGWVGTMELHLLGAESQIVAANALLEYAAFWGIGKGTTAGMGQIKLKEIKK